MNCFSKYDVQSGSPFGFPSGEAGILGALKGMGLGLDGPAARVVVADAVMADGAAGRTGQCTGWHMRRPHRPMLVQSQSSPALPGLRALRHQRWARMGWLRALLLTLPDKWGECGLRLGISRQWMRGHFL